MACVRIARSTTCRINTTISSLLHIAYGPAFDSVDNGASNTARALAREQAKTHAKEVKEQGPAGPPKKYLLARSTLRRRGRARAEELSRDSMEEDKLREL